MTNETLPALLTVHCREERSTKRFDHMVLYVKIDASGDVIGDVARWFGNPDTMLGAFFDLIKGKEVEVWYSDALKHEMSLRADVARMSDELWKKRLAAYQAATRGTPNHEGAK